MAPQAPFMFNCLCADVEGDMVDRQLMFEKQSSEGFDKLATIQSVTFIAREPFDDGTRFFPDR